VGKGLFLIINLVQMLMCLLYLHYIRIKCLSDILTKRPGAEESTEGRDYFLDFHHSENVTKNSIYIWKNGIGCELF
jgi:hypothetical protein